MPYSYTSDKCDIDTVWPNLQNKNILLYIPHNIHIQIIVYLQVQNHMLLECLMYLEAKATYVTAKLLHAVVFHVYFQKLSEFEHFAARVVRTMEWFHVSEANVIKKLMLGGKVFARTPIAAHLLPAAFFMGLSND